MRYPGEDQSFGAPYPWLTASTGDIDVTGRRRPISYYRETVYGLRNTPTSPSSAPTAASTPSPPRRGPGPTRSPAGHGTLRWGARSPVTVEAYTDADEVEFHLNGRVAARATVRQDKAFVATADVPYEPGTFEAVAFRGTVETGRCRLPTPRSPTAALPSAAKALRPPSPTPKWTSTRAPTSARPS